MSTKNRILVFSIATVLLIVVAVSIYMYKNRAGHLAVADQQPSATTTPDIVEYAPPVNDIAPAGSHTYINEQYGFSLDYPDTLAVEERAEAANGRTITFESADGTQGFQIFITPYAQKQIDKSRIDLDTHGTATVTPEEIVLKNGTQALLFQSSDPILGDLREVWFLHGGYLYEVTSYLELDTWLSGIMQTFTFNTY